MKLALALVAALLLPLAGLQAAKPLNILFFTADDMNFDSSGVCGGPIKDLTPNLDRLAGEGLRFEFAYSTVAVCQPVRQTMQTGLYPHRSGSMGFYPIKPEVRTLNQQLHAAGYLISRGCQYVGLTLLWADAMPRLIGSTPRMGHRRFCQAPQRWPGREKASAARREHAK
jgi:hypothetical protein